MTEAPKLLPKRRPLILKILWWLVLGEQLYGKVAVETPRKIELFYNSIAQYYHLLEVADLAAEIDTETREKSITKANQIAQLHNMLRPWYITRLKVLAED